MNVNRWLVSLLAASVLACPAWAQVGIAVGVGGYRPYGYYRPYGCYRPYGYGWGPPLVVGVGAPVVYPPPLLVPPVTVVAAPPPPVQVAPPPPPSAPVYATAAGPAPSPASQAEIERCMAHLVNPDANARTAAVVQLGRLHATQAVEQMSRVLATDRSPTVREAAARGLGLVGSPAALPALQQAAQADENPEVRNSARFAVETIRSQNP